MKQMKNGFTLVELLVVIGILGILMMVLVPNIAAAMQNAKTNACAIQGRQLFVDITQSNIARDQKGMVSIWPRTDATVSDDQDDISGTTYTDSAKYFEELFNIKNYGTAEWDPYVKSDLKVLSGFGVPPFSGKESSLSGDNILWCVAKGVEDDLADVIPVLVTRNACVEDLFKSGDFKGTENTEVKIGKDKGGESNQPFGKHAFVVVRKNGASDVIEAKYSKQYLIYMRQGFSISPTAQFEYLKTGATK